MEQTLMLLERVHAGDKEAREQLIEENMGLVYTVAQRFLGRGCEHDDLVQIGCIGLMKAVDKFDTEYDVKFSTYAVPMIMGEIRRHLRDNNSLLKVSRSLKESAAKAYYAREELERKSGREPTLEEIAAETGLGKEDLVLAMEAASGVESLSQTVYSGDGTPVLLGDRVPDTQDRNEELLNRMLLEQLLELLAPEEQRIIRLRYFEERTQMEIAKELGMTQVQVSRAEKRILKKMREAV